MQTETNSGKERGHQHLINEDNGATYLSLDIYSGLLRQCEAFKVEWEHRNQPNSTESIT